MLNKIIKGLKSPGDALGYLLGSKFFKFIPDEPFLKIVYFLRMKKSLNIDTPRTFNEKLQWLKINNKNPSYTNLVDKEKAKIIISKTIGEKYIIPTLAVYESFEDIDFQKLPNQFVLKCTHDSGSVLICENKNKFKIKKAKNILKKSLRNNYFWRGREYPYKNIAPKIIAEQYMGENLRNNKLFPNNQLPRMSLVYSVNNSKNKLSEIFYDDMWSHVIHKSNNFSKNVFSAERPEQYNFIRNVINNICFTCNFTRIDFYEINANTYYGEIDTDVKIEINDNNKDNTDIDSCQSQLENGITFTQNNIKLTLVKYDRSQMVSQALVDYKFFCFNGEADSVMVCTERETGNPKYFFLDQQWNLKRYNKISQHLPSDFKLPKPNCIDEMFILAEKLSKGIPFVRVDFYTIDDHIYFGELTFFPDSGFDSNILLDADKYLGKKLKL